MGETLSGVGGGNHNRNCSGRKCSEEIIRLRLFTLIYFLADAGFPLLSAAFPFGMYYQGVNYRGKWGGGLSPPIREEDLKIITWGSLQSDCSFQ